MVVCYSQLEPLQTTCFCRKFRLGLLFRIIVVHVKAVMVKREHGS
jgi:hypothetical protein